MHGISQLQQRAFRIGIGDDRLGAESLRPSRAARRRRAILYANLNDFRAGADFRSGCLRRRGHGLRDRSHAPAANYAEPAGCGSPAARISSTSALPADHGPRNVPKMPRAAITARSSSVSKYSEARSATAIGPQRSSRNMSFLPSLRMARPVLQHAPQIAAAGIVNIGRRGRESFADDVADLAQRLLELRILRRVLLRECSDLLRRLLAS